MFPSIVVVFGYWRGFLHDRGTWVALSVAATLVCAVIVKFLFETAFDDVRTAQSTTEKVKAGLLYFSVALVFIGMAGGAVAKAAYENARYERHKENHREARGEMYRLLEAGYAGKDPSTVNGCMAEFVEDQDWSGYRVTPGNGIRVRVESEFKECVTSAPTASVATTPGSPSSGGNSNSNWVNSCLRDEPDCDDGNGGEDYWVDEDPDPCAGYNVCTYGPSGVYGEDWINDPWDRPGDGR